MALSPTEREAAEDRVSLLEEALLDLTHARKLLTQPFESDELLLLDDLIDTLTREMHFLEDLLDGIPPD